MSGGFSDHDVEHHRLRVQMLILEQLVLKLFVVLAKSRGDDDPKATAQVARALLRKCTATLRESPQFEELDPAEQAMFQDESAELFADLEKHLDFILAGAL